MERFSIYLFFFIIIMIGVITNQIAGGYTGGENPDVAMVNELYNTKMLSINDLEFGEGNPLGMEFGGGVMAAPMLLIQFFGAVTLDYPWLKQSNFAFIRWIYLAFVGALILSEAAKMGGGILNAFTSRFLGK